MLYHPLQQGITRMAGYIIDGVVLLAVPLPGIAYGGKRRHAIAAWERDARKAITKISAGIYGCTVAAVRPGRVIRVATPKPDPVRDTMRAKLARLAAAEPDPSAPVPQVSYGPRRTRAYAHTQLRLSLKDQPPTTVGDN